MSIYRELKRRNVFRVAVAYIIVAWLVMQVAEVMGPALHLPEWATSFIAYILILGLPVAIVFAWAFELTPGGLRREEEHLADREIGDDDTLRRRISAGHLR